MTLKINDTAPDFEAETTEGKIKFHDWIGDKWVVLFSHPKDFTPVCTTELGYMAKIKPEFDKRGVKIIGLSVDPIDRHAKWADDIKETQGHAPNYPMIGDPTLAVSKLYGMLPAAAGNSAEGRTPADNQTVRNVFVIGPDKKIKLVLVYPMTTGRNFDEVLRVIDSLQLTAKHKVATPAQWQQGDDVIIAGSVSNDQAKAFQPFDSNTHKGKWRVVFFWPKDFTFVCPTEIAAFGKLDKEFKVRDAQLLGVSTDSEYVHLAWRSTKDELKNLPFPMLSDIKRELTTGLGILDRDAGVAQRATYIVDPEGVIRFVYVTDLSVGRSPEEVLRVLDALQTDELCPCNWKQGEDTLKAA